MAPRRKSFADLKGLKFAIPAPASVGEESILHEALMKATCRATATTTTR